MQEDFSLGELAVRFGLELRGDPGDPGVARRDPGAGRPPGSLSFLAELALPARARRDPREPPSCSRRRMRPACPVAALVTPNPLSRAYARIATLLHPEPERRARHAPDRGRRARRAHRRASATVGPARRDRGGRRARRARRGGSGLRRAAGARLGADTRLVVARDTLYPGVAIGARCLVHAGAVIGADGFGFALDSGTWVKVPQVGSVRIGDDVEIGANTTIDRGAIGDTVIEEGAKLDNQIQVGSQRDTSARIPRSPPAPGISGSTTIGKRCMIGGMVGFAGHLTIADDVVITGCSLVSASIREPGSYSSGMPTVPHACVAADGGAFTPVRRKGAMMAEPAAGYRSDHAALPHRYPFLLVDRVLDCQAGNTCTRIKNVTFNEPFFPGHFPHRPVMPGVMIIEALAQACGILAFKTVEVVPDSDTRFYFVAIDDARFRKPVEPGDQLLLEVHAEARLQGNLEVRLPRARWTARRSARPRSWLRPRPRRPGPRPPTRRRAEKAG